MAGFTEIEMFIDHLAGDAIPPKPEIRRGYYLRSLAEMFVPVERIGSPQ
jgi:hypothetical protein